MIDLHHIKSRVKILAKALGDLIVRHHHTMVSCQSLDVHVPVALPRDYEFSCSSTPASRSCHVSRSKRHSLGSSYYYNNHVDDQALEIRSTSVRQGNVVTNEPPNNLKNCIDWHNDDCDMGTCVDKAAEEFIARFYKELRLQN